MGNVLMRIPYVAIVKIVMDEIYNSYVKVQAAKSPDSDGGAKVTRAEIWDLVTSILLNIGPEIEQVISKNNRLTFAVKYRWHVLSIIVESLNELPEGFESAKADDDKIDREEAMEIVAQILKNAIPKILKITVDDI